MIVVVNVRTTLVIKRVCICYYVVHTSSNSVNYYSYSYYSYYRAWLCRYFITVKHYVLDGYFLSNVVEADVKTLQSM